MSQSEEKKREREREREGEREESRRNSGHPAVTVFRQRLEQSVVCWLCRGFCPNPFSLAFPVAPKQHISLTERSFHSPIKGTVQDEKGPQVMGVMGASAFISTGFRDMGDR